MDPETLVVLINEDEEGQLVEGFICRNLRGKYIITYYPARCAEAGVFAPLVYLISKPDRYYYGGSLWPFLEDLKKKVNPRPAVVEGMPFVEYDERIG